MTPARRIGWGVADQAVSSITNFCVLVVAAGALGRAAFGAFAIALAVAVTIVGVARAVAGEPLTVRFSAAGRGERHAAARSALGAATIVSGVGAALVVAVSAATGGQLADALLPLGLVLPGLVLQDTWRFVLIADGRPAAACASDLVWGGAQAIALAVIASLGDLSLATIVLVWGVCATLGAVTALLVSRLTPHLGSIRSWLREQRDLWPRFAAEWVALTGSWQVALVGLAAISGLDTVGALRAAQVLVGPLNVAFLAVPLVLVPESSRLWRAGRGNPLRHSAAVSVGLGVLAVVWGGAASAVPTDLGRALLGASWSSARALLVPVALVMAAVGVTLGALSGLRVLAAARESLRARIASTAMVVAGILVGGLATGASGAAWGWAFAASAGAVVWWSALQRAWRRHMLSVAIPALAVAS